MTTTSHSTRVRGLKWLLLTFRVTIGKSHSTRVRGLKSIRWSNHTNDRESHSTRVRGLKSLSIMRISAFTRRTLHECVDWNTPLYSKLALIVCRTLHECVDWNNKKITETDLFLVALYTSAWIEIVTYTRFPSLPSCRTLHECVDWNSCVWTSAIAICSSHSTRVRGLKSPCRYKLFLQKGVALYTSAWIEISIIHSLSSSLICRTLHECVDWNR